MPAVLVESFFVDNTADKKVGDTVAEQKAFGKAYAKAILEYLGIVYKNTTPTYKVQAGAFGVRDNAENLSKKLKKAGFDSIIVKE